MLKYDRFGDTDYNGAKCKQIALNINRGQKKEDERLEGEWGRFSIYVIEENFFLFFLLGCCLTGDNLKIDAINPTFRT